jgi:uncharacterized protein
MTWRGDDMRKTALGLLLVLLFCTCAVAETSVWKAQKGKVVLYLGGTCHLLRASDFPLPPEFEKAYRASDVVVFETDLAKLQDASMQQKLMSSAMYHDGTTIADHLSPKAYQQLKAYCDANGIPLSTFGRFKPGMLMVTLSLLELMKLGVTQEGVDKYFYQLAQKEHKPVDGLETAEQQIEYVMTMADGSEEQFVSYSLEDMKTLKEKYDELSDAWRRGDAARLDRLMIAELKGRQPDLYKRLITNRNRNWLRQIDRYEKEPQTRFILVGVGHLVGENGIIESLKKKGYRIEQLLAATPASPAAAR